MGDVIIGIIGSLLGVAVTSFFHGREASRAHKRQQQDLLKDTKRRVYAEYVRAISASYAQAQSHDRSRSEDGKLWAATAEIKILSSQDLAARASSLTEMVIHTHNRIACGELRDAEMEAEVEAEVAKVDGFRQDLIRRFKKDLGIEDTTEARSS